MASRFFGGSRPSKSSKLKSPDPPERPSALPKRSGIPMPPPSSTSAALKPSLLPKTSSKAAMPKAPGSAPAAAGRSTAVRNASTAKSSNNSGPPKTANPPISTRETAIRTEISTTAPTSRTRLRRKPSGQDPRRQYAQSETSESSREQYPVPYASESSDWEITDPHPGTLLGIPMPPPVCEPPLHPSTTAIAHPIEATSNSRINLYNARQQLPKLTTPDPPPNAAGSSSTPSTRFSGSPGNFSRGSTPTSASSHSPSLMQTPKFGTRTRPSISPATSSRPPVVRRTAGNIPKSEDAVEDPGLPAVRESRTSSSSSSPVKALERAERTEPAVRKSKLPPPTPPLRLSSKRGNIPRSVLPAIAGVSRPTSGAVTAAATVTSPGPLTSLAGITSAPPTGSSPAIAPTALIEPESSTGASRDVLSLPTASRVATSAPSTEIPSNPVQSKKATPPERTIPPPRPSREGLPALEPTVSPVIQSNMAYVATTGRTRRESISRITAPVSAPTSVATSATTSARTSHSRSTSVTSATSQNGLYATAPAPSEDSPHLYPRDESKTHPPVSMRTDLQPPTSKRDPSPGMGSPSRSPGRFGLFSRRLKSPSETSIASPPSAKLHKKGPAAGTGHEGYGRYARRGRSTSVGTARSRNPSTSTDQGSIVPPRPSGSRKSSFNSTDGKPELDEFFRDRLAPITIGGGGVIRENRNSKTSLYQSASEQSSVGSFESARYAKDLARQETPSVDHGSLASSENVSRELLPAPRLVSTPQGIMHQERTIAHRRSLHRSQQFGEDGVRVPPPINTRITAPSPGMETYDSTVSSILPTDSSLVSDVSEGHEGNWLRSRKVPGKGKTTRRWNIFRRNTRSPEPLARVPKESFESERGMPAQVMTAHGYGPVAHYTMMDEDNSASDQELEEKLRTIESNLQLDFDNNVGAYVERDRQPSMLLPPPPLFPAQFEDANRSASPRVPLNQSPGRESGDSPRQPRLQQVGRIPRVISNRDRQNLPASQSFSRPFPSRPSLDECSSPQSSVEPSVPGPQTGNIPISLGQPHFNLAAVPIPNMMSYPPAEQEFLRMSPRKDSELTSGSSESGVPSLAPITAIPPTFDDVLSDDEIWNEFDDLIDRVSPPIAPESPGIGEMLYGPTTSSTRPPLPVDCTTVPNALNHNYQTAVPIKLSYIAPGASRMTNTLQIRRPALPERPEQQQTSTAQPLLADNPLSSPFSLSSFYSNYGNRSGAGKPGQRLSQVSATSGSRYSSQTIISESGSRSSLDSPQAKRVTQVMAEKTYNASSDSLRFSALMTSRWLSFDRVLFSPAQDEIRNARQSRVLVLDGLGNDDWSAYCALTYPEATVYNLSPANRKMSVRDTAATANNEAWAPPPNLRRVAHSSLAAPFPFPKGFFAVVVLRFPAADTPNAYKHAISECKRVLKPGGYLELSILDIDMVNMGNRVRRAIRGVKERMAGLMPDVSLGPASDAVIKLLGRRGFENLNRCVVSVPLASSNVTSPESEGKLVNGSLAPSDDLSRENHHSFQELLQAHTKSSNAAPNGVVIAGPSDYTVKRHSPSMIGRVAQWWWSRCYETPVQLQHPQSRGGKSVVSNGESSTQVTADSVWSDPALLQECADKQTGLRLVICYAQKPESVRRRTVSV